MLLAVDAGNTNVTFAVFDGEELRSEWRTTTNASRTADDYAVWLVQLMALTGLRPDDIDEAIIATVVPQALFDLRTLCRRYFHCDPLVIGADGVDLGIYRGELFAILGASGCGTFHLSNHPRRLSRTRWTFGGPLMFNMV